ncbi:unnamed protein product [Linum tenue]|uniref:Polygalacturonase n=1 Tax=Linum tenue TaxID=586396 RepID=A0AAV0J085_9ROSI|nr:unnamed protein product [Linum tenue]
MVFHILGVVIILLVSASPSGRADPAPVQYSAINCRKHTAVLTDFGAVGDGKTLNTKAFETAVANLSQFAADGGAQLIVPAGKWLTGSFNLTSHFTLFLHKDAVILGSQSGIRIKTAVGRGGYVKDIFARRMTMSGMEKVFWMSGAYKSHADGGFDPNALPVVHNINYRDVVAQNVTVSAILDGLEKAHFTGICISNVTLNLGPAARELQWNCTNVSGTTSRVTPKPCDELPEKAGDCPFPEDKLPIDDVVLKSCSTA